MIVHWTVHWITSSIHENSSFKPRENMLCTEIVLPIFCKKKSFWQRFTCMTSQFHKFSWVFFVRFYYLKPLCSGGALRRRRHQQLPVAVLLELGLTAARFRLLPVWNLLLSFYMLFLCCPPCAALHSATAGARAHTFRRPQLRTAAQRRRRMGCHPHYQYLL